MLTIDLDVVDQQHLGTDSRNAVVEAFILFSFALALNFDDCLFLKMAGY